MNLTPQEIIRTLGLQPHPEGGWFGETFRDVGTDGGRGHATAIYFLLEEHQRSHWHRVDATELWLWHAGTALRLELAISGKDRQTIELGPDLDRGQRPQVTIPAAAWQSATPLGGWALVSCVVAPAFEFAGFELAPEGFEPD